LSPRPIDIAPARARARADPTDPRPTRAQFFPSIQRHASIPRSIPASPTTRASPAIHDRARASRSRARRASDAPLRALRHRGVRDRARRESDGANDGGHVFSIAM